MKEYIREELKSKIVEVLDQEDSMMYDHGIGVDQYEDIASKIIIALGLVSEVD